jgi:hypothetical protein
MSRRGWLLSLIFLLPIAALVAWWLYTFKPVLKEVDLPARGEARYNPLFALKLSLQAHGIEVASGGNAGFNVGALAENDALLLYSDIRTISEDTSRHVLDWVEQGGHLIFAIPSGSNDRPAPLLEQLGLYGQDHYRCLDWNAAETKEEEKAQHCFLYRFQSDDEDLSETFAWLWGNDSDGYLFGRQFIGDGSVFIAGELDFLVNADLNEPGHAALAWQVLAPALGNGKHTVHLIYAADVPPMYVLIVHYGWPILLPIFIALLMWLWSRSQRFGPLLPLASMHRRALLDHVQASGEFVFRRGRMLALHAAVHRLFVARLRRRDPTLAALEGEALVQALATRCQYAAAAIRQALNPTDLAKPDHFVAAIKTLMQLREKL